MRRSSGRKWRRTRALLLVLLSAGCASRDARPRQATAGPLAAGDYDRTLFHGGIERGYLLHLPPAVERSTALPLVLAFHGGGGHGENQREYSKLHLLGDREGFVTVYPDGTGGVARRLLTWNAGSCCGPAQRKNVDDVDFVRKVVDDVAKLVSIDRRRVYATGLSNGAMLSYRLAIEAPDLVAAIAPVAGANAMEPKPGTPAVPVLHIHSVDDPRALYAGGLGPPFPLTDHRVLHPSVETVVRRWAAHDGCAPEPVTAETRAGAAGSKDEGQTATRWVFGGCRDESAVELLRLTGAGHVWPGGDRNYLVRLLGRGTSLIDANQELWAFFRRFRRPLP